MAVIGTKGVAAHANQISGAVRDGARAQSHWIVRAARIGYAAKGLIYLVIGALALRAAMGAGGGTTNSRGALRTIGESGFGRWLLLVIGVGLLGWRVWALVASSLDAEDRGSDAKGIAIRIGQALRGLVYGALGVEAMRLFMRSGSGGGGGGAEHWSARLMELPWGRWLLALAGAAVAGYALFQIWRGAQKELREHLRLGGTDSATMRKVIGVARVGIIARGIVFLVIGWLLVQAALRHDASRAGGVEDSLGTLASRSHGAIILATIAVGLMAYAVWQFVNARYREMPVT